MEAKFAYTGLRVGDLDKAIDFFTRILGMKLHSRVDATWNKGIFATVSYEGEQHYLELNWYAPDSPYYTKFTEGEQLDHLGIKVEDFEGTLKRLTDAGYPVAVGPFAKVSGTLPSSRPLKASGWTSTKWMKGRRAEGEVSNIFMLGNF